MLGMDVGWIVVASVALMVQSYQIFQFGGERLHTFFFLNVGNMINFLSDKEFVLNENRTILNSESMLVSPTGTKKDLIIVFNTSVKGTRYE